MQAITSFTYHTKIRDVFSEMSQVVVGQDRLLNRLLIGLFTGGHILLEGVPGLAKTLTINTLAKVLELDFQRIQFTPDLLPADLIGTMIFNQKTSEFEVKQGPIFANLILADEVNRSPAKVQAALLEAMQEKQVTIGEETFVLDRPFLVLATQNPVEQEGTYPLPEAQVDRFMMKVFVDYLSREDELAVMRRMSNMNFDYEVQPVLGKDDLVAIRDEINGITISETLEKYIIELVFATRKPMDYNLRDEARYIQYGVSPRASINLNLAAKALAYFDRRDYVLPEDIKEVAPDVFNHRIMLNYEAEADGVTTLQVIESILRKVAIGR
ncbi:AAA family ATPase [Spirosoma utsteinense]|uniref:MoxR-like ATPase n=1 Tax=Spirosoma utsteinense TaxID=2585773 RepID=A0ABR6W8B6_9BACT|nr:MoxR family ATPase [Spirosoma utsteinense]MBC3784101.1 MoxR-like ATPase [Spirosoma utsteinense]MBC3792810.1 MoxR-like ATPase [Spirosoma utsteinense]